MTDVLMTLTWHIFTFEEKCIFLLTFYLYKAMSTAQRYDEGRRCCGARRLRQLQCWQRSVTIVRTAEDDGITDQGWGAHMVQCRAYKGLYRRLHEQHWARIFFWRLHFLINFWRKGVHRERWSYIKVWNMCFLFAPLLIDVMTRRKMELHR